MTMSVRGESSREFGERNVLSSKELFAHRKPFERSLPKTGVKDFAPDGSWLHHQRLEQFYEERRALISEQRVEKIGNLVKGEWVPEKHLVELEKELGKFWAHMGFIDEQRKWLYPEEALFLMETSVLEVWYGGVPFSIQQGYSSFLGTHITLEEYQVYAHLRRLGFVLIRHTGIFETTRYEKRIRLDQHKLNSKRKRKLVEKKTEELKHSQYEAHDALKLWQNTDNPEDMQDVQQITNVEEQKRQKLESGPSDKKLDIVSFDGSASCSEVSNKCDNLFETGQSVDPIEQQESKLTYVDFSSIEVPSVFGKEKVIMKAPQQSLLPTNLSYPGDSYEINLSDHPLNAARDIHKSSQSRGICLDCDENGDNNLEFSFSEFMGKSVSGKISARNWREYKRKKRQVEEERSCLENSPVCHLWKDDVTPLLMPKDAISTGSLLQKLRVIRELETKPMARLMLIRGYLFSCDIPSVEAANVRIIFDVYQPDSKFKKSTPGTPHFRIFVQRHSDNPPQLSTIMAAVHCLPDDVPLLCAVVDAGNIAMYTFTPVSLPVDISTG